MADLGGRRGSRRARAIFGSGERAGEQREPLGGAAFDHREHEQPIEQALGLAACGCDRAARPRSRRRSRSAAGCSRRAISCATWTTWRVSSCASRAIARDEIGALGIAADQRQRRLRGLALAVQVIGVDRIEIAERDAEPARIGRRRAGAHRRVVDHVVHRGADVQSIAREEGVEERLRRAVPRGAASARRRCARRSSRRADRTIDGTLAVYNELLIARERDATRSPA